MPYLWQMLPNKFEINCQHGSCMMETSNRFRLTYPAKWKKKMSTHIWSWSRNQYAAAPKTMHRRLCSVPYNLPWKYEERQGQQARKQNRTLPCRVQWVLQSLLVYFSERRRILLFEDTNRIRKYRASEEWKTCVTCPSYLLERSGCMAHKVDANGQSRTNGFGIPPFSLKNCAKLLDCLEREPRTQPQSLSKARDLPHPVLIPKGLQSAKTGEYLKDNPEICKLAFTETNRPFLLTKNFQLGHLS